MKLTPTEIKFLKSMLNDLEINSTDRYGRYENSEDEKRDKEERIIRDSILEKIGKAEGRG